MLAVRALATRGRPMVEGRAGARRPGEASAMIASLNVIANLTTAVALLCAAIPLLLRAVREVIEARREIAEVHKIVDRREKEARDERPE